MKDKIEKLLEQSMFSSRWFMAPVYIVLSITLFIIMAKVVQSFVHELFHFFAMSMNELLLFVLHIIDLALIGNLVLMIIFAGYENFVSKIDVAKDSEDKPDWMGKVDFSGLKLKLIASVVAISSIGLLEAFISIESKFLGFPALNVYKNLNPMPTAKADCFSFSVNKLTNFFEIDFLSFRPT